MASGKYLSSLSLSLSHRLNIYFFSYRDGEGIFIFNYGKVRKEVWDSHLTAPLPPPTFPRGFVLKTARHLKKLKRKGGKRQSEKNGEGSRVVQSLLVLCIEYIGLNYDKFRKTLEVDETTRGGMQKQKRKSKEREQVVVGDGGEVGQRPGGVEVDRKSFLKTSGERIVARRGAFLGKDAHGVISIPIELKEKIIAFRKSPERKRMLSLSKQAAKGQLR